MKPTFKIEAAKFESHHNRLLILIHPDIITSLMLSEDDQMVSIHSYHLPQEASAETAAIHLKQILSHENILKSEVNNTCVIYGYPSAILAPAQVVNEDSQKMMMEMMHGEIADAVLKTDDLEQQGCKTIYAIPRQVDSVISFIFSNNCHKHLYTLLARLTELPQDCIYCIFGSSYFTSMLVKEGKLQVIQTYQYKTADDASYYLLQMSHAYSMNTNSVSVLLNGMISAGSNLFNGISKYFLNIEFAELPQQFHYPKEVTEYPSHYFSHLFSLVKCVL